MNERFDADDRPAHWREAIRVDVGRLARAQKTAVGVRVEAVIARAGILTYQRADGTTVRELLPPEEAGRLDSLKSLRDAPVTVMHPGGGTRMVSPETYRSDAVGHVSGEPRFDGTNIVADLAIQEAGAIARVDAGELVENSAGYRCYIDPTPGVWKGERYDQVQRLRTYNHTALLPAGMARAGRSASLRLDGGDRVADVAVMRLDEDDRTPAWPSVPERAGQPEARVDSVKTFERIDGRDYEVGTPEWRSKLDEKHAAAIAAVEKRAKDAEEATTKERARADAAEARVKELETAASPERVDARAAERASLFERVRPVLGKEAKLDGLTDHQIRQQVCEKLIPDFKTRLDAEPEAQREMYVRIRFDAAMEQAGKRTPLEQAREDALGGRNPNGSGGGAGGRPAPLPASAFTPNLGEKWRHGPRG